MTFCYAKHFYIQTFCSIENSSLNWLETLASTVHALIQLRIYRPTNFRYEFSHSRFIFVGIFKHEAFVTQQNANKKRKFKEKKWTKKNYAETSILVCSFDIPKWKLMSHNLITSMDMDIYVKIHTHTHTTFEREKNGPRKKNRFRMNKRNIFFHSIKNITNHPTPNKKKVEIFLRNFIFTWNSKWNGCNFVCLTKLQFAC